MNHLLCLLIFCLFPALMQCSARTYLEHPYKDKTSGDRLTFALTFDKYHVNADFAKGDSVNLYYKNLNLALRGIIGFDTRPAFKAEGEEVLHFRAKDNLSLREGTVTFWAAGMSYAPSEPITKENRRSNICFFMARFFDADSSHSATFKLYDYNCQTACNYFSSVPPQGFNQGANVLENMQKYGLKANDYYMVGLTWNASFLRLYINGKLVSESNMPVKHTAIRNWRLSDKSFFEVRPRAWSDDRNKYLVSIDDFKIYSDAKTAHWLASEYQRHLPKDEIKEPVRQFNMEYHGRDTGTRTFEGIEFIPDLSAMGRDKNSIRQLELIFTDKKTGAVFRHTGKPRTVILKKLAFPAEYDLQASLVRKDGSRITEHFPVSLPDLSFIGCSAGLDRNIPSPWTKPVYRKGVLKLWNRTYRFDGSPFPASIRIRGKELFRKKPELLFQPNPGKFRWRQTAAVPDAAGLTFRGKGTSSKFSITYETRIDFDGATRTDFIISGCPELTSMKLAWQLDPAFSKNLMTPSIEQTAADPVTFPMGLRRQEVRYFLWLNSLRGGFCFDIEHDANWVFNPEDRLFSANRRTGECSVQYITRKVRLPENTAYHALTIATPTRPTPKRLRGMKQPVWEFSPAIQWHFGNVGENTFETYSSFKTGPNFSSYMKSIQNQGREIMYYSTAETLSDHDPVMRLYRKYWNIPGAYMYRETWKGKPHFLLSACTHTSFPDYLMYNLQNLFRQPGHEVFKHTYYDLANASLCANPLHHCYFKDVFGRRISRNQLLSKRSLFLRTLKMMRSNGGTFSLHAQNDFSPFTGGLADYWLAGEQNTGLLARNPYGYTEITDLQWDTEYNRDILGSGVLFLPSIRRTKDLDKLTESMLSIVLLHDLDVLKTLSDRKKIFRLFDAYTAADVYHPDVKAHRVLSQKEISSPNKNLRFAWYETPSGPVIIASNPGAAPAQGEVIFRKDSPLPADGILADYWRDGKSLPEVRKYSRWIPECGPHALKLRNRKFLLSLPARSFAILKYQSRP